MMLLSQQLPDCINLRVSLQSFYVHTERRLPICYLKNMIVPHILLQEKEISYEEGVQDGMRRGLQQSEQAVAQREKASVRISCQ